MRRMGLFVVLVLLLCGTGCVKPWDVVQQVKPNPYRGGARLYLVPLDYARNMRVGRYAEGEFLRRKDQKTRDDWREIKRRVVLIFHDELMAGTRGLPIEDRRRPGANDFQIIPTVVFMQPGFFAGPASVHSEITLRVQIVKGRDVLDEFVMRCRTSPLGRTYIAKGISLFSAGGIQVSTLIPTKASAASRLQTDASYLGRWAADYLRQRMNQK